MNDYKLGDTVKLKDTGPTYPCTHNEKVIKYVRLYNPINLKKYDAKNFTILSGYNTIFDLSKQTNLIWKIKCVITPKLFIISSNQNHILVCNPYAIQKL